MHPLCSESLSLIWKPEDSSWNPREEPGSGINADSRLSHPWLQLDSLLALEGLGSGMGWMAAGVSRRCCQGLTRVMTGEGSTAYRPRGANHSKNYWFSLKACAPLPVTPFLEGAHPADFLADSLGWQSHCLPRVIKKASFLSWCFKNRQPWLPHSCLSSVSLTEMFLAMLGLVIEIWWEIPGSSSTLLAPSSLLWHFLSLLWYRILPVLQLSSLRAPVTSTRWPDPPVSPSQPQL